MIVWNEYNCQVSGGTYKFVECEDCKQKYVYRMMREAAGQGNSLYFLDNAGAERRAKNQAEAILKKTLAAECDAVPCPKCGAYQQDMMAKLCREYRLWMFWTGVFAIFAGVLSGSLGFILFEADSRGWGLGLGVVTLLGFAGGIGLIVWRRKLADAFEPNDTPLEDRLAIAAVRSTKVNNFEKWLKEQEIDADQPIMN